MTHGTSSAVIAAGASDDLGHDRGAGMETDAEPKTVFGDNFQKLNKNGMP